MLIPLKNMQGENVGEIELLSEIFEAPINIPLMHQALVRQLSNARLGTHKSKTRSENNRSKSKWYRQKGTGRARHGSRNAPIFVGGGIAHGPLPRDYTKRMPKKMRRAALRSALSDKAATEKLVVLSELAMDAPKTKQMVNVLKNLTTNEGKTLIVLPAENNNVELSARNLQNAKTLRAEYLNIRDILTADFLVMPLDTLTVIQNILGDAQQVSEEL
jgi:large subunit ribosomal protein L4